MLNQPSALGLTLLAADPSVAVAEPERAAKEERCEVEGLV
jgi:hypothetical protein